MLGERVGDARVVERGVGIEHLQEAAVRRRLPKGDREGLGRILDA